MHLSHVEMVKAEKPGSIDAMRLTQHGTERLIGLQLVGYYLIGYCSCTPLLVLISRCRYSR